MTGDHSGVSQQPLGKIDTTVPHSARIWNYWLGGKDNYEIDRQVGEEVAQLYPGIRTTARLSRALRIRVIGYLAGEAGIRHFLDVGTGLPTANNTHPGGAADRAGVPDRLRGQRPCGARPTPGRC